MPMTSAYPLVGVMMFISILIAVVLPAPLGPTSAKTAPSGTDRSKPRSASTVRNFLIRLSVRIALFIAFRVLPHWAFFEVRPDASNGPIGITRLLPGGFQV